MWNKGFELAINLELRLITGDRVAHRPFVAIWVEDKDKAVIRNVSLWYNKPKWLKDLHEWYRLNYEKFMAENAGYSSLTSATRSPGKYVIKWDGKDAAGVFVKPGNYVICIEVAREHGTYQIIRQEIECNKSPKLINLAGNVEIASASLDYRKNQPNKTTKRKLSMASRWLHIYVSMVSFAIVLFFAVTGITLNHADKFAYQQRTKQLKGTLDTAWVKTEDTSHINKLAIVEYLRTTHKIKSAVSEFRIDDLQCNISFKGPGYGADAFINRQTGAYEITEVSAGFVGLINDLHKGRDTGAGWLWVIDLSAAFMVLVSLTGIILLLFIKKRKISGLIVAGVGVLLFILIYFICAA